MADISSITLQDGNVYTIKDATARQSIPVASDSIPMTDDVIGSAGTSSQYARADHTHPVSSELTVSMELEYKLSSSDEDAYAGDTIPAGADEDDLDELWFIIAPALDYTHFLWQRYLVTYVDGTVVRGTPSCISSVTERVEVATNLANLSNEYYLSTSRTALTGGAWSSSVPSLSSGYYIWTRIRMETVDGSYSYSDPMLHDALNSISDILTVNNALIEAEISDLSGDLSSVQSEIASLDDWITTGVISKPDGTPAAGVKISKTDGSAPYSTVFTGGSAEVYENTDKLAEVSNKKVNAVAFRSGTIELATGVFASAASDWRIGTGASGFTIKWIGG